MFFTQKKQISIFYLKIKYINLSLSAKRLINAKLIIHIMAYELIFNSTEESHTYTKMVVNVSESNRICIKITDKIDGGEEKIHLEKGAAIKLAKELRRQISYLQD